MTKMEAQLHYSISDVLVYAKKLQHDVENNTKEEQKRAPTYDEQLRSMLKPGEKSPRFVGQLETLQNAYLDGEKSIQRLYHYSQKLQNLMDPVVKKYAELEISSRINKAYLQKTSKKDAYRINVMDIIDHNIIALGGNIYE